jgi:hypothetical protein
MSSITVIPARQLVIRSILVAQEALYRHVRGCDEHVQGDVDLFLEWCELEQQILRDIYDARSQLGWGSDDQPERLDAEDSLIMPYTPSVYRAGRWVVDLAESAPVVSSRRPDTPISRVFHCESCCSDIDCGVCYVSASDDDTVDSDAYNSTVFRPVHSMPSTDNVETRSVVDTQTVDVPDVSADGYSTIIDQAGFGPVGESKDSKDHDQALPADLPSTPTIGANVPASHSADFSAVDAGHSCDISSQCGGARAPPHIPGLEHLDDVETPRVTSFLSDSISRHILGVSELKPSFLRSAYTAVQDIFVGAAMYLLLVFSGSDLTGLWLCFWGWCSLSLMKWCAYGTSFQRRYIRPTRLIIYDWAHEVKAYVRAGFFNCVWIVSLWREWPSEYYILIVTPVALYIGWYFMKSRSRIIDQAGFWERENHVRRTHLLQIILAILSLVSGAGFMLFNQVQPAFRVTGHILGLLNPATGCVNQKAKGCATRYDPHMKCNSCTEAEVTSAVSNSLPQDGEVKLNRASLLLAYMIDNDGKIPDWFEKLSQFNKELILSNLHITLQDFESGHYAFEINGGRVCLAVPKNSDWTFEGVRAQYVRTPEGLHKMDRVDKDLKPHKAHSTSGRVRSDSPDWRKQIAFKPRGPRPRGDSFQSEEKTQVIEEVENIINQVKDAKMSMGGIEVAESADGYLITVEAGTNIVLNEQIWWHKYVPRFLHNKIDHLLIVLVVALIAVFIYVFNVNRDTNPTEVVEAVGESSPKKDENKATPKTETPPQVEATRVDPDVSRCVESLVTKIEQLESKQSVIAVSIDECGDVAMANMYGDGDEYGDKQSNKRKANVSRSDIKSGVNLLREDDTKSNAKVRSTVERNVTQKGRTDKSRQDDREGPVVQKSVYVFYQQDDIIKHLERHAGDSAFKGIIMYNKSTNQRRNVKTREEVDKAKSEGFQIAAWLLPEEATYLRVPLEKFNGDFPPVVRSMLNKYGYLMKQEEVEDDRRRLKVVYLNVILSKEELEVANSVKDKLSGDAKQSFADLINRSNSYWRDDAKSPKHDFGSQYPFTNTRAAVVHAAGHPSVIQRAFESLKAKSATNVAGNATKVQNESVTNSTCTLVASGFCKSEYCRLDHSKECVLANGVWRKITKVESRPANAPKAEPSSPKVTKSKAKKKQSGSDPVVLHKLVDEASSSTIRSDQCPYDPCTITNCIKQHKIVVVTDEKSVQGMVLDVSKSEVESQIHVLNESNLSGSADLTRTNGAFTLYCKRGLTADRRLDAIGQCWMGPHRLETVAHNFWDANGVSRVLDFSDYYILGPDRSIHYAVAASVQRYKFQNTDLVDDYASFEVDPHFMKELHSEVRYSLACPKLGGKYVMVVVHPSRGVLTLPVEVVKVDTKCLVTYTTDTESGYSGAAIIDKQTGKVVCRHKGAIPNSKYNCAVGHSTPVIAVCGSIGTRSADSLPKN